MEQLWKAFPRSRLLRVSVTGEENAIDAMRYAALLNVPFTCTLGGCYTARGVTVGGWRWGLREVHCEFHYGCRAAGGATSSKACSTTSVRAGWM
jgi:hypothetical protein